MKHRKVSKLNDNTIKYSYALLITPLVMLVCSVVLLIFINLFFNSTFWMRADTDPVAPTPDFISAINAFLLIAGAIGLFSLLPGMIIGSTLLLRNKTPQQKKDRR